MLTVIDGTNRDVDTVNRLIQRDRLRRGELGSEALAVTATDEGRSWHLHTGDRVIFLEPYRRPRLSVRNGTTGQVVGLDLARHQVRIRLTGEDREVTLQLKAEDHRQPVGLAYAVHAAKFQGGEVDVVQALPGSPRLTDANAGYSQLTRAIEAAHLYLDRTTHGQDPLAGIAKAWSRPGTKLGVLQRLAGERQRLREPAARAPALARRRQQLQAAARPPRRAPATPASQITPATLRRRRMGPAGLPGR